MPRGLRCTLENNCAVSRAHSLLEKQNSWTRLRSLQTELSCNIVPFPKVCFIQSCHSSSFLRYLLIHTFWDCAIWQPQRHDDSCLTDTTPFRHRLGAEVLRVVNPLRPPRCRRPSHISPVEDYFCWLVVMLAHICQSRRYSHPLMSCTHSLRLCEGFCVTVFGGGTPQRDTSQSAT